MTEVMAACGYCEQEFDLAVLDLHENNWYNQKHSVAKLIDCFINSSVCLLFSGFGKKKFPNLAKHATASDVTSVPIKRKHHSHINDEDDDFVPRVHKTRYSVLMSDSRHTPHQRMANPPVTCKSDETSSTSVSNSSKTTAQDICVPGPSGYRPDVPVVSLSHSFDESTTENYPDELSDFNFLTETSDGVRILEKHQKKVMFITFRVILKSPKVILNSVIKLPFLGQIYTKNVSLLLVIMFSCNFK